MSPHVFPFIDWIIDWGNQYGLATSTPGTIPFSLNGIPLVIFHDGLTILSYLFALVYLVVSGVLFYHWKSYGMGNRHVYIAGLLYGVVSIILFVTLFILLSYI